MIAEKIYTLWGVYWEVMGYERLNCRVNEASNAFN